MESDQTLDAITARWKDAPGRDAPSWDLINAVQVAVSDIRTLLEMNTHLLEMVRARDKVVEAAQQMERSSHTSHWDRTGGSGSGCPACLREIEQYKNLREALAALANPEK